MDNNVTLESVYSDYVQRALEDARGHAFPSPVDWRDHVIYFVMIDRFNNPLSPPRHVPYDDPLYLGFQGGSFAGIIQSIPYLKKLGVGVIWLSPVLKNLPFDDQAYHGYGIHDFLRAEPRFAADPSRADEELRQLVDTAHAAGIFVVVDVVLNHTGDVFSYQVESSEGGHSVSSNYEYSWKTGTRRVLWKDEEGSPKYESIENIGQLSRNCGVWPLEFQKDRYFRRQGGPLSGGDDTVGDYCQLKQFKTEDAELQQLLIRVYQYIIARFDFDGFRVDTLRYLKGGCGEVFSVAIKEYAHFVGKHNFFLFGGRHQIRSGMDTAFDYLLFDTLKGVVKGFIHPSKLTHLINEREDAGKPLLGWNCEGKYNLISFLENHDDKERFRARSNEGLFWVNKEVTLGLGLLFTLPGIPMLLYGVEQGLTGSLSDTGIRGALWGITGLKEDGLFFDDIRRLISLRERLPALRYGRCFARPTSNYGLDMAGADEAVGIFAFSRILAEQEVLIVANVDRIDSKDVYVIVDSNMHQVGARFALIYDNGGEADSWAIVERDQRAEGCGDQRTLGRWPMGASVVRVMIRPLEIQVFCGN